MYIYLRNELTSINASCKLNYLEPYSDKTCLQFLYQTCPYNKRESSPPRHAAANQFQARGMAINSVEFLTTTSELSKSRLVIVKPLHSFRIQNSMNDTFLFHKLPLSCHIFYIHFHNLWSNLMI